MQLSMKCSIAVHCLIFIWEARGKVRVISPLLSESTGCNPVVIRGILSALKKGGLITVERGKGGASLCRKPEEINLYEIYSALEPEGLSSLIGIHPCEHRKCPIARNIRQVLELPYEKIEESIRRTMMEITLESMVEDYRRRAGEDMGGKDAKDDGDDGEDGGNG